MLGFLFFATFLGKSRPKNLMRGYVLTVEDILALYGSELNIKEETRRTLRPDGFQILFGKVCSRISLSRGRAGACSRRSFCDTSSASHSFGTLSRCGSVTLTF